MKQFFNLFRYEMRVLLLSPTSYLTAVLFLFLMGFLYLFILEGYSQSPQEDLPSTELFRLFWIPVFFIVPLLTMKSLAEEQRLGTLETLLSTPVTPFSIVLSKFLSAYIFYITLWFITLSFPLIVEYLLSHNSTYLPLNNSPSIIGGLTFVALSGTLYIALGIFTSSLTRSQLVAGMFSFTLLFIILVGGRILLDAPFLENNFIKSINIPLDYFQTFQHLEDFSLGIIDTRPFFFYLGNSLLILGLTSLIVEAKA